MSLLNRKWKHYDGKYEVSNYGEIRNAISKRVLRQTLANGYCICVCSFGGRDKKRAIKIHRAVAELFVDNPYGLPEVNHIDGNKLNNRADNLEWCTRSENISHAYKTGLEIPVLGENKPNAVLTDGAVRFIRKMYKARDRDYGARALARRFGVHHSSIEHVVHNTTWRCTQEAEGDGFEHH